MAHRLALRRNNMERNITITLEKAREWYNSDNESLKEVALQAFSEDELIYTFRDITTFKKACEVLNIHYEVTSIIKKDIAMVSKASAAMFKLNIIRKALNLGQDLHLTKDPKGSYICHPFNPITTEFATYSFKAKGGEIIGKVKIEGKIYEIYGNLSLSSTLMGIGNFESEKVGYAYASNGFLSCASKEIAQHFSKYFGILITEAKYGDMIDFEIIENKYQ